MTTLEKEEHTVRRKRKDLGKEKNSMLGKQHELRRGPKTGGRWCRQGGPSGTHHPLAERFILYMTLEGVFTASW